MTQDASSTRRSFLKGGAFLAAPIAVASAPALALADDALHARVKRLEDVAAIRDLHESWLRGVNSGKRDSLVAGSVRRILTDHAGAPDSIDVAADGRSASGCFECAVEVEAPLAENGTLAQMAHAQGNGTVRRTERAVLRVDYAKTGGVWEIRKVTLARS